ncbi:MAG: PGF-CTERM sorting domain-containing protein [Candidatus Aenigmatarchaeota archaeon]
MLAPTVGAGYLANKSVDSANLDVGTNILYPEKSPFGVTGSCTREFYELGGKVADVVVNNCTAINDTLSQNAAQSQGFPGFEAFFAVTGLLAVSYLVLRRRD